MLNAHGNRLTYFGHSTFSITTPSGQVALIDPWVMTNPVCPEALKTVPRLMLFFSRTHIRIILAICWPWRKGINRRSWRYSKPAYGLTPRVSQTRRAR